MGSEIRQRFRMGSDIQELRMMGPMRSAMEPTIGQRLRMGAIKDEIRKMRLTSESAETAPELGFSKCKMLMPLLIIAPLRPSIQSQLLLPRVRVLF